MSQGLSYYVKVYNWSKDKKKYEPSEPFYPGTASLSFHKDIVDSVYADSKSLVRRKKGYFNPFSPNFLSWETQPAEIHYSFITDVVALHMEYSIFPTDNFFKTIHIDKFWSLTHDRVKNEQKYPKYTLVIDGKEYDMEMLKDKIEHFNMVLVNLHNKDALEGLE